MKNSELFKDFQLSYLKNFHHSLWETFFVAQKINLFPGLEGIKGQKMTTPRRFIRRYIDLPGNEFNRFTPNQYRKKKKGQAHSHAESFLRSAKVLMIDYDCQLEETKAQALSAILEKCRGIAIEPSFIVETYKGFHVVFLLKYPITHKTKVSVTYNNKPKELSGFNLVKKTQKLLNQYLGGDPDQPGLSILTALPARPDQIHRYEPSQRIQKVSALLWTLREALQSQDMEEGEDTYIKPVELVTDVKNGPIYTALLLARDNGIDDQTALNDILAAFPDLCGNEDQAAAIASAYGGNKNREGATKFRHATKLYTQQYYGCDPGELARSLGWSQREKKEYVRVMADNELETYREEILRNANKGRAEVAWRKIEKAAAEIKGRGDRVSASAIKEMTGISFPTLRRYSFLFRENK